MKERAGEKFNLGKRQEAGGRGQLGLGVEIKNYKDLQVWQKSRVLVKQVYLCTSNFPNEERFGLTSQLIRASVSVPSNIAESHSRRGTKDYIQFVSYAIGSLAEVETQIILSIDLSFLEEEECKQILSLISELQKMLYSLRKSLKNYT